MTARHPSAHPVRREAAFDVVGFVALSITPGLALYQGVVAASGVLIPFDETTAALIPLATIVGCLILRLANLTAVLASPAIRRASMYLTAYILVVLFSTLIVFLDPIERNPTKMFQQYLSTVAAILVFLVMVTAPGLQAALRALKLSILIWAFAAVITPLTALTPLPIGEVQGVYQGSQGVRSFGVLGDGGTFVVSFLTVAFFASRRIFWLLLSIFALIFSGSRMALVVAGAGIGLVLVLSNPKGRARRPGERALRVVAASAALILLLLALQLMFSIVSERFGLFNAFERLGETQLSESDRLFSISQGLEWFQMSPLYGHGFNSYFYFSLRSAMFGANQSNALNQIVQTLMDGGLLALVFLALFFIEIVRPAHGSLIDRARDPFAIRAWLLAFLVINQTAVYILPAFFLTILVFGVAGVALHARESAPHLRTHPSQPQPRLEKRPA